MRCEIRPESGGRACSSVGQGLFQWRAQRRVPLSGTFCEPLHSSPEDDDEEDYDLAEATTKDSTDPSKVPMSDHTEWRPR
jgi:hypothetical protein